MAKKKSGKGTWIAGAVLGAVAGAAYALWKTPMSGQELRGKLSTGPIGQRDDVNTDKVHSPNFGDVILSKVEHTLAPIVGVTLGKTANGPAPTNGAVTEPISVATPPATQPPDAAPVEETPADQVEAAATTPAFGGDTIRSKRFAWGSPTPEAGVTPVPVEPVAEPVVAEPAPASEPVVAATTANAGGTDTIRAKRFAWGDPAPDAADTTATTATATVEHPTAPVETVAAASVTSPVEAVSNEASVPGSNMRKFPKLGGLEN